MKGVKITIQLGECEPWEFWDEKPMPYLRQGELTDFIRERMVSAMADFMTTSIGYRYDPAAIKSPSPS